MRAATRRTGASAVKLSHALNGNFKLSWRSHLQIEGRSKPNRTVLNRDLCGSKRAATRWRCRATGLMQSRLSCRHFVAELTIGEVIETMTDAMLECSTGNMCGQTTARDRKST